MINKGRHGHVQFIRSCRLYLGSRNVLSCRIRTVLLLFVMTFLWIQFTFGNFFWLKNLNENSQPNGTAVDLRSVTHESQSKLQLHNNDIEIRIQYEHSVASDVIAIREEIRKYNEEQTIRNEKIYEPLSNDSLVIVVQVHQRIGYLKYLIESLSKARNINETLLIFSHDVYDEDLNALIQNIAFCKVIQIFLPYSVQAYPDEFPGNDPNDCPRDIGKERAFKKECLGAEHPDKYGHYRESKFTQIKHHWWWKMNHVFNHLALTKAYTGLITFLEEDNYIVEDFIHILKIMNRKCAEIVDCYFLGLGFHVEVARYNKFEAADQVKMNPLTTNLGLTFNRTTFNILLNCSERFCKYDDYNWDWTLNYITQTCSKTALRSMIPAAPRLFHTGVCGTHVHGKDCKEHDIILKIQGLLRDAEDKLYPKASTFVDTLTKGPNIKENGGWGDKRDHELCMVISAVP